MLRSALSDHESDASLQLALATARKQGSRGYELRAAMSLARLWGEQGRRAEAQELLAPVYGWFTEGFDTADLKRQKVCCTSSAEPPGCADALAAENARII